MEGEGRKAQSTGNGINSAQGTLLCPHRKSMRVASMPISWTVDRAHLGHPLTITGFTHHSFFVPPACEMK